MELKPCPFCGGEADFSLIPTTYVYNSFILPSKIQSEIKIKAQCPACNYAFSKNLNGDLRDGMSILDVFQLAREIQDLWNRRYNDTT